MKHGHPLLIIRIHPDQCHTPALSRCLPQQRMTKAPHPLPVPSTSSIIYPLNICGRSLIRRSSKFGVVWSAPKSAGRSSPFQHPRLKAESNTRIAIKPDSCLKRGSKRLYCPCQPAAASVKDFDPFIQVLHNPYSRNGLGLKLFHCIA